MRHLELVEHLQPTLRVVELVLQLLAWIRTLIVPPHITLACFPPDDIVQWFGHHSNGPSVKIPVPPHAYRESTNWIGLAVWAYFSVLDHSTANLDHFKPDIPHHLTCYLETDTGSLDYFHSYITKNEEFKWLRLGLGGFIYHEVADFGSSSVQPTGFNWK